MTRKAEIIAELLHYYHDEDNSKEEHEPRCVKSELSEAIDRDVHHHFTYCCGDENERENA